MADDLALAWMAVQIDRCRIDHTFLTKSVMPLFNATTAAGISDWPFYSVRRNPASFRIWFSIGDPHLVPLLRPAIEDHFHLWIDSDLKSRKLLLHYGQPEELANASGTEKEVRLRMLHLISGTCLRTMHCHRNEWSELEATRLALQMQLILLKAFAPGDTEAVCIVEQFFRKEVRERSPRWQGLTRLQKIELVEQWRHRLHAQMEQKGRLLQLRNKAMHLWQKQQSALDPELERFGTVGPVLVRSLKSSAHHAATHDPDEGLPTPASWDSLHHFFRQIHNNLLLGDQAALLTYSLIPQAIQQATSRLS